jgi:hypothetical protein
VLADLGPKVQDPTSEKRGLADVLENSYHPVMPHTWSALVPCPHTLCLAFATIPCCSKSEWSAADGRDAVLMFLWSRFQGFISTRAYAAP